MTLRPIDPIAAEIHDLTLSMEAGRACAQGIEDRRARRRILDQVPGETYTPADLARFRRRDYDAVKRAKLERARVAVMLDRVAELRRLQVLAADL